jgi:hypothetical protein
MEIGFISLLGKEINRKIMAQIFQVVASWFAVHTLQVSRIVRESGTILRLIPIVYRVHLTMEIMPKDRALPFIVVAPASYRQQLQRQAGLSDGFLMSQSTATTQHHSLSILRHRLFLLTVPRLQKLDIARCMAIHTSFHSMVGRSALNPFSSMGISGLLKVRQCGFKATMRPQTSAGLHGRL